MNNAQELIHAVEVADSSSTLLEAVENLAAAGLEESIPTLIAALGYNNPGAAVAAVDGLIKIGEPSVKPLLELIDDYNYGARAWAVRALAGIGDPRGLDILLEAAQNDFALSVRRAAARGLGTIHWQEMPTTTILPAQTQVLSALIFVCADSEWIVRYAAVTGLESLAKAVTNTQPKLRSQIITQLEKLIEQDTDLAVRTRVLRAQQQINDNGVGQLDTTTASSQTETSHRGESRRKD